MRTSSPGFGIPSYTLAALGAVALFGATAEAADLVQLQPLTVPVETWTGFSVGVGGGLGILDADVNGRASREDTFGRCGNTAPWPPCEPFIPFDGGGEGPGPAFISQSHQLNVHDLKDEGPFGTVRGAYDYQFAPTFVVGGFIDYDFYDIDGHAKQRSSVSTDGVRFTRDGVNNNFDFTLGDAALDAKAGLDSTLSVDLRLGWLARPNTLLYVLGGYTHAWLDNPRFKVNISDPASPNALSLLSPIDTHYLLKLSDEADGFNVGVGSEVKIGPNWSLLGEYRFMSFDLGARRASNHDLQCCVSGDVARKIDSNAAIDMDLDVHTVRAMLAYRF